MVYPSLSSSSLGAPSHPGCALTHRRALPPCPTASWSARSSNPSSRRPLARCSRACPSRFSSALFGRDQPLTGTLFAAAAAAAVSGRRVLHGTSSSSSSSRPLQFSARAGLGDYSTATAAAYGASLLLGGLFAFFRTGSKGSLGGGLTGAALYAATLYLLQSPSTESLGNALGFGAGLLFSAVFAIRLVATGKPVPAGPLLAVSALASAVFASAYFA